MHQSEIWHSKKNDCRLSRTQVKCLISSCPYLIGKCVYKLLMHDYTEQLLLRNNKYTSFIITYLNNNRQIYINLHRISIENNIIDLIMKKLFAILFFIKIPIFLLAQSNIVYKYDDSGNRIERKQNVQINKLQKNPRTQITETKHPKLLF